MTLFVLEPLDRFRDTAVCAWHGCTSRAFIWHSNEFGEYVPVCREHDREGVAHRPVYRHAPPRPRRPAFDEDFADA